MFKTISRLFLWIAVIVGISVIVLLGLTAFYLYIRFTRDLPQIDKISDYRPKAVTKILAEDGTLIAEAFDERRYPVSFAEIPQRVKNAFLAAEDANFYTHPGVDLVSILRALWINLLSHSSKQGASTITQQIVKSLLLTREKTYERKIREAILSYRLEKALSKDEIFSIYLNEIFLGNGAYGVKAAAWGHFRKTLDQLSLAESAYLAGLPQKPSQLSKSENRDEAINRQRYVLKQMLDNSMISKEEWQAALTEELKFHPADTQTIYAAPYYAGHAIKVLDEIFSKIATGQNATNPGGFVVQTVVDINADLLATKALQHGLRALDKRRGWRGPLGSISSEEIADNYLKNSLPASQVRQAEQIYQAVVRKIDSKNAKLEVQSGEYQGIVDLSKTNWAKTFLTKEGQRSAIRPELLLRVGDVIEVIIDPSVGDDQQLQPQDRGEKRQEEIKVEKKTDIRFLLDQSPKVEGAVVLTNALTGEVKAIVGGYDYQRSIFNRATQARLQPGSAFKPFVYLAAVEELKLTPATIVPDEPISMIAGDGKLWSPQNFDEKFLGPITLRTALQRSRNVVSVYLLRRVGVERGINAAKRLGISTPIAPNMSIALGTAEVHLIELVRAYGAFAAEGWLATTLIVKSIRDRNGKLIYEQRPHQVKVIKDEDAFIMAHMMKGVVERGTAQVVKKLNRPVAGKTGTTNDHLDAWFIGYTPEWVAGVWTGFDEKQPLGRLETGGHAAAPIFVELMEGFLADMPTIEFNIPDGVTPVAINLESGNPVEPDSPGAFIEYFKTGTEPTSVRPVQPKTQDDYLNSDEF